MNIAEIMTTDVVSVRPQTPFKEVVELLVHSGVSGAPVIADDGRLVGIVTEADLTSKEAYSGRRQRILALLADALAAREHHWSTKAAGWVAADVMTKNVVVCSPDDDVRVVARRMLERGVKRMPVERGGKLVGIVSRRDILRMFARPDDAIAGDVTKRLAGDPNRPDDCHVHASVASGVVTLSGDVRFDWDKASVISLVRDVPGVIEVTSHVHNREPDPRPAPSSMFGIR